MKKSFDKAYLLLPYLVLKPIYLWKSGGLQLSDYYLIVVSVFLFISARARFRMSGTAVRAVALFAALCIYQLLVNLVWTGVTGEILLKSSLYYIFNFVAFFVVLVIGNEVGMSRIKKGFATGMLIALVITGVSLLLDGSGGRRLGFFNNPNQLGYFALIALSFAFLCEDSISRGAFYASFILSTWEIIASGSKAACLAVIAMYVLYVFYINKDHSARKILVQLLFFGLIVFGLYLVFFSNNSIVTSNATISFLRGRILRMGAENDTALSTGRGYNRIFETGIHFLWGVGEGANDRFSALEGKEAHSSYITLLVSYGLIGFLGYFLLVAKCMIFKGRLFRNILITCGILLYGVSHNGLRNTLVWMLLALLLLEGDGEKEVANSAMLWDEG